MSNHISRHTRGFTLIEILVSTALFSVVMVVALGALLSMSVSIRRAELLNSVVNNLSSALDSMSRSVRTGTNYRCGSSGVTPLDCASEQPFFTYLDANNVQVEYCLSVPGSNTVCNSSTLCASGSCSILRKLGGGAYATLTAPEVQIQHFGFIAEGTATGDNKQPKVTILLSGTAVITNKQSTTFNLQTSVTQRLYDL